MTSDQIFWVTSYPARLAEISGKLLIESWQGPGQLLVFTEGIEESENIPKEGVRYLPLDRDAILLEFLRLHASVIPKELGGKWEGPCACSQNTPAAKKNIRQRRGKYHALPCPEFWFCKHMSRWFRKVVAMHRAITFDPSIQNPVFIWIDADCEFVQIPTPETLESWFQGKDVFYFKHTREATESGLFGLRGPGLEINKRMMSIYLSSRFLRYKRWDDCHVFDQARRELPRLLTADLAVSLTGHADVIPSSIAGPYIQHSKGRHGRVTGIFK